MSFGASRTLPLGGVLALDRLQLLGLFSLEHVLEELVEVAPVADRALGCAALVEDRDGGAVVLGLL